MGREAVCTCDWAGEVTEVKALLEAGELILRGGLRKRIPFNQLQRVRAISDRLCFKADGEAVELVLGASAAAKWAEAITTPTPSLARKLGISSATVVRSIGNIDDANLKAALAEAAGISATAPDLVVACVDTPESLHRVPEQAMEQLLAGVPIWIVYPKGPGHALNETAIRALLRSNGMMDTKVASVSSTLTALRFNRRKSG